MHDLVAVGVLGRATSVHSPTRKRSPERRHDVHLEVVHRLPAPGHVVYGQARSQKRFPKQVVATDDLVARAADNFLGRDAQQAGYGRFQAMIRPMNRSEMPAGGAFYQSIHGGAALLGGDSFKFYSRIGQEHSIIWLHHGREGLAMTKGDRLNTVSRGGRGWR